MPTMPGTFRPRGAPSRREARAEADRRRGSARERGYTAAWDRAAKAYLRLNPLCAYCLAGAFGQPAGTLQPAEAVDHLYPQRQGDGLMWDDRWWVATCDPCHDGPKQRAERAGREALDALALRLGRPVLNGF